MKLKVAAGLFSLIIMGFCGTSISWQLRHQDIHATPPAIFFACAVSSLLAGFFGWRLSCLYSQERKFASLIFPLSVLALTATSVSIVYLLVNPLFRDWEYLNALKNQLKNVPFYIIFYTVMSAPIWLPGLAGTSYVLHKISRSKARI